MSGELSKQSVIEASNQKWKVFLSMLGVFSGGFVFILETFTLKEGEQIPFLLHFGSSCVVIVSFIFACIFIRCPNCRTRWILQGIHEKKRSAGWLPNIMSLQHCPVCRWPVDSNRSNNHGAEMEAR